MVWGKCHHITSYNALELSERFAYQSSFGPFRPGSFLSGLHAPGPTYNWKVEKALHV